MPNQSGQRIIKVSIPASTANAGDPWTAGLWVFHFVDTAVEEAGYDPDELPADAVRFAALWTYVGEQSNGGHAQYHGNSEGNSASWRRAAELLGRIGLPRHRAVLDQFIHCSLENEERLEKMYAAREEAAIRKLFGGFDDQFDALRPTGDDLLVYLRDWLLRQPWLEIDHRDGPADMNRLRKSIAPHAMAKERRAAWLKRGAAENHGALMAFFRRFWDDHA